MLRFFTASRLALNPNLIFEMGSIHIFQLKFEAVNLGKWKGHNNIESP
jgi:hypothetical protein